MNKGEGAVWKRSRFDGKIIVGADFGIDGSKIAYSKITKIGGKYIVEQLEQKKEFVYRTLIKFTTNPKREIEGMKFDWKWIREWIIEAYDKKCAVTGRYIEKYMGVHFFDLDGFKESLVSHNFVLSLSDEGNNDFLKEKIDITKYAVCMCEAAMHGLTGFALFNTGDWLKNYIEFEWSEMWDSKQVLMASLSGQINKPFFKRHMYKIGLYNRNDLITENSDQVVRHSIHTSPLPPDIDQDLIADIRCSDIKHIPANLADDEDLFVVLYNDTTVKILKDISDLYGNIKVVYKEKYNMNKNNKESISLIIKHKKKK